MKDFDVTSASLVARVETVTQSQGGAEECAGMATPRQELERQIMSSTVPKNEREWWAHREIERLRAALIDAKEAVQSWGAYADSYFQEKWELAGDIAAIDAALSSHSIAGTPHENTAKMSEAKDVNPNILNESQPKGEENDC